MDWYLDIRILPDPEFPASQLMNALFSKLHRALVALKSTDIGVSFPEGDDAKPGLGSTMRLHGTEDAFLRLMAGPWLSGMRDYVHVSAVARVPANTMHRRVRRVQVKSNPDRIRRRQMRRHGWTEAEGRSRVPDDAGRMLTLPFLVCDSGSTGHRFRLFIEQVPADRSMPGTFNAYGLSPTRTIPWF